MASKKPASFKPSSKRESGKPAKKQAKPAKSKKRQEDLEYAALRKPFMLANPRCLVPGPSGTCNAPTTECHHRKGRGRHYLDVSTWIAVCKTCHDNIHTTHQTWARKMGLLVNYASTAPCPPVSPVFLPYEPNSGTAS